MLIVFTLAATALLGGAVGALIVYRVYAPKMRKGLYDTLLRTVSDWDTSTCAFLQATIGKNDKRITDDFARMESAITTHIAAEMDRLRRQLQEQIDILMQDAAEAIDNRIANASAKPTEAKLDGVSTDKPDEVDEDERRQATGGKFHM